METFSFWQGFDLVSDLKVGIAIITFQRPKLLNSLLESIKMHTSPEHEVVIFDDSGASLPPEENAWGFKHFTTILNYGVTFNKNRALYYFTEVNKKDVIILIEDDCLIESPNWVDVWVNATNEFGHINFEPKWFLDSYHSKFLILPSPAPDRPAIYSVVTGQVTGIKTELIRENVGYLNPIFRGFGYGHVEWTNRCVDLGFGGFNNNGKRNYYALNYGIVTQSSISNKNATILENNRIKFEKLNGKGEQVKIPWGDDSERDEFTMF